MITELTFLVKNPGLCWAEPVEREVASESADAGRKRFGPRGASPAQPAAWFPGTRGS